MPEKKPYSAMQLIRVELNHEQAVLSTCALGTASVSNSGNVGCRPPASGGCKKRSANVNNNSGPRPS
jgi:hypothetical protein